MGNTKDELSESEKKIAEFAKKLRDSQEELDPDMKKILSENIWDLYAR